MEFKGTAASAGIGIGSVVVVEEPVLEYVSSTVEDTAADAERLGAAIENYIEYTNEQAAVMRESVGEKEAEILTGHVVMISDPYMKGEMVKLIEGGMCAEDALVQICDMFATMFEATGDELTMQRATDVRDVKTGVLAELLNKRPVDMGTLPLGSIVVTHDLTPSMTAGIRPGAVEAVITETGGLTSHSAILARAMEIPAVLSIAGVCHRLADGDQVIVDGSTGVVTVDPTEEQLEAAREAQAAFIAERAELVKFIGCRSVTASGEQVELFANIGKPEDAAQAMERDAEGIGLFRTEFLFMDSTSMPTEDQQFEAYKKAALICKNKPLIIRYCLAREDVYRTQLRALLRASAFGEIRIMVPLVTCVDELTAVKALVKRYMQEFDQEGVAYNPDIQIGVMVETPAAAVIADLLAEEADFFSIGTNDLTGYTMCADRGNDKVRYLYSTCNPAVLRSIRNVISAGNAAGIQVGMCGESAADPMLVPLWIAFGLGEYSVSATSVLATRKAISLWTKDEACALAEKVMQLKTATEVYDALQEAAR